MRLAAIVSSSFLIFTVIWVFVSGAVVENLSNSIADIRRFETYKGIAFSLATSIFFFLFIWGLLERIRKKDQEAIRNKEALLMSERRAIAGMLAASVAHDINNVLMILNAGLESFRLRNTPQENSLTGVIAQSSSNLSSLSERLINIGRQTITGNFALTSLAQVINNAVDFAKIHLNVRKCMVTTKIEEDLKARVNPIMIEQALINLLLNSADATGEFGEIEVRLRKDGGFAVIEVHDDGPGIEKDLRDSVFEPFYTSKAKGSGLGLISVRAAADMHNGTIEALESSMGGACFRLRITLDSPQEDISLSAPGKL